MVIIALALALVIFLLIRMDQGEEENHVLNRTAELSYEDDMTIRTAQAIANGTYPRWYWVRDPNQEDTRSVRF
jgi:hypothetical protein